MRQFTRGVLGFVLATAMAVAQASMSVTSGVLRAGQSVQITYSDPSRAYGLVVVLVEDEGFPIPVTYEVVILLDSRGCGTTNWIVPECDGLLFNAPGAREVMRWVK